MPHDMRLVSDRTRAQRVVGRSSRRLRIALVGPSRHPLTEPFAGGLESLVHGLARSLRERGHEVTLFAATGSDLVDDRFAFEPTDWSPSEAAAADRSMPPEAFIVDHHQHLRLMMALAGGLDGDFDVIHNHSLHHLPVAMAGMVRTPIVTTLHTPPTPWLESAVEVAGDAVARWTAVSNATAAQWHRLQGQVSVVRNGVDVSLWPRGTGGTRLVWSGRLVPEKAPHLAALVARRAGLGLDIAGPVGDADYVERVLAPLLDDEVRYVGHLPQRELATLVGGSAAALVTPVWDEPFGLVAAEATACGTPVLAFDRGGLSEVVVQGRTGLLLPPGDVEAMALAVPEALRMDRSVVREVTARRSSQERMVRDYEAVYETVIEGRRMRRSRERFEDAVAVEG